MRQQEGDMKKEVDIASQGGSQGAGGLTTPHVEAGRTTKGEHTHQGVWGCEHRAGQEPNRKFWDPLTGIEGLGGPRL